MRRSRSIGRVVASSLLLMMFASTSSAVWAAEPRNPTPLSQQALALAAAAPAGAGAAETTSAPTSTLRQETPGTEPAKKSFFKTPQGIAALVLMAGVVGWTIESRINGAVHSPGRQ